MKLFSRALIVGSRKDNPKNTLQNMNPPQCEICEKAFDQINDYWDCIICGQHCCKNCIDTQYKICKECDANSQLKDNQKKYK